MTTSDTLIRCFFSYRIWKLSNSGWLMVLVLVNTAIIWANGLVSSVKTSFLKSLSDLYTISWLVKWQYAASAGTDVLITLILCFLLFKMRTGFKRTNDTVNTLMVYAINTGALTSVLSIACMIAFLVSPTTYVWMGILFTLPKFFLNALLATLNARHRLEPTGELQSIPTSVTYTSASAALGGFVNSYEEKV